MASAEPGGGGENPPPNRHESNGNDNMNQLDLDEDESASDLNVGLNLVPAFISAKNSVELHKRKDFQSHRSLPSVFKNSKVSHSQIGNGNSSLQQESRSGSSQSVRNIHHVNWADLHSSHGQQFLAYTPSANLMKKSIDAAENALLEAFALNSTKAASASDLAILHGPTKSHPYVPDKSSVNIDVLENTFVDAHHEAIRQRENNPNPDRFTASGEKIVPLIPNSQPIQVYVDNAGQTPNETLHNSLTSTCLVDRRSNDTCHINENDGLLPDVKKVKESPESIYLSPVAYDNPFLLPLNQMSQIAHDPVAVYYQESYIDPIDPIPPENKTIEDELTTPVLTPPPSNDVKYYDFDDELDFDKKPESIMKGRDEIPVPDPAYVTTTVHESLIPLIAKTYKKDCRTWLWKSRAQREAKLKEQAEDEANGIIRQMPRQMTQQGGDEDDDLITRMGSVGFGTSYYS